MKRSLCMSVYRDCMSLQQWCRNILYTMKNIDRIILWMYNYCEFCMLVYCSVWETRMAAYLMTVWSSTGKYMIWPVMNVMKPIMSYDMIWWRMNMKWYINEEMYEENEIYNNVIIQWNEEENIWRKWRKFYEEWYYENMKRNIVLWNIKNEWMNIMKCQEMKKKWEENIWRKSNIWW